MSWPDAISEKGIFPGIFPIFGDVKKRTPSGNRSGAGKSFAYSFVTTRITAFL